jgi:tetratricopeptide (TPR) repeat protein
MLTGIARGLVVIVATLWLAGCASNGFSTSVSNLFGSRPPSDEASAAQANAEASEPEKPTDETTTGTVPPPLGARPTAPGLLGSDPYDELSLGKKYYRSNNYGIAEKHFRRAVESHPRDAEAWLGLAASYDRLRRFDLADRAYGQAVGILGPTAEILTRRLWLPSARIPPTNMSRTTCVFWKRAIARARPSNRPAGDPTRFNSACPLMGGSGNCWMCEYYRTNGVDR